MAAPDPLALCRAAFNQGRWLGVVDHYIMRIEGKMAGILPVNFQIFLEHLLRKMLVLTLESIVEDYIEEVQNKARLFWNCRVTDRRATRPLTFSSGVNENHPGPSITPARGLGIDR